MTPETITLTREELFEKAKSFIAKEFGDECRENRYLWLGILTHFIITLFEEDQP